MLIYFTRNHTVLLEFILKLTLLFFSLFDVIALSPLSLKGIFSSSQIIGVP